MENINYQKYGITARKHGGDDQASWAVFLNGSPILSGLTKREVPYYKNQVYLKFVKEK